MRMPARWAGPGGVASVVGRDSSPQEWNEDPHKDGVTGNGMRSGQAKAETLLR